MSMRQRKERISRSRDWSAKRSTQVKRTGDEKSQADGSAGKSARTLPGQGESGGTNAGRKQQKKGTGTRLTGQKLQRLQGSKRHVLQWLEMSLWWVFNKVLKRERASEHLECTPDAVTSSAPKAPVEISEKGSR